MQSNDRDKNSRELPSPDVLRVFLCFDPSSGRFFWRERLPKHFAENGTRGRNSSCAAWNSRYAGRQTMNMACTNGYHFGQVQGVRLLAHRTAWAIHFGNWPASEIDHVDGNRTNNSISNLRQATRSQNNANRLLRPGRRYRGVYPNRNRWTAYIQHSGKTHYLGSFATEIDAARAYDDAARSVHGEFANPNFPDYIAATQDAVAGQLTRET